MFRRAVNRCLARFGYSITRHPSVHELDGHLRAELRRLEIDCIIDVGANIGQFSSRARQQFRFDGDIVAFEPATDSYERLRERFRDDRRHRSVHAAAGDKAETANLHRFARSSLNSLHSPSDLAHSYFADQRIGDQAAITPIGTEDITVVRLDQVLDDHAPGARRILLKVDTQGHDLAVIAGAQGIMSRVVAVLSEAPVQRLYEGAPDVVDHLLALRKLGFALGGMWSLDRTPDGAITEVDAFFVRPVGRTTTT